MSDEQDATESAEATGLNPDYRPPIMRWNRVEIVAPEGTSFGILHDGDGDLSIAIRVSGGDWPNSEEPKSGLNTIAPAHKAYQVFSDECGPTVNDLFRAGAQAMREMLARFVEHGGDSPATVIAGSMRANWNPAWGADPGRPEKVVDNPWEA